MNCKICILPTFDKSLRVKLDCCKDSFICYDCCKSYLEETRSFYCPVASGQKHLLWFSEGDKTLRRILKLNRALKYKNDFDLIIEKYFMIADSVRDYYETARDIIDNNDELFILLEDLRNFCHKQKMSNYIQTKDLNKDDKLKNDYIFWTRIRNFIRFLENSKFYEDRNCQNRNKFLHEFANFIDMHVMPLEEMETSLTCDLDISKYEVAISTIMKREISKLYGKIVNIAEIAIDTQLGSWLVIEIFRSFQFQETRSEHFIDNWNLRFLVNKILSFYDIILIMKEYNNPIQKNIDRYFLCHHENCGNVIKLSVNSEVDCSSCNATYCPKSEEVVTFLICPKCKYPITEEESCTIYKNKDPSKKPLNIDEYKCYFHLLETTSRSSIMKKLREHCKMNIQKKNYDKNILIFMRILERYESLLGNYYKVVHKFYNTMIIDKRSMRRMTFFPLAILRWLFQKIASEEMTQNKLNFIYKIFYVARNLYKIKLYLLNRSIKFLYEVIFSDFSEIEMLLEKEFSRNQDEDPLDDENILTKMRNFNEKFIVYNKILIEMKNDLIDKYKLSRYGSFGRRSVDHINDYFNLILKMKF